MQENKTSEKINDINKKLTDKNRIDTVEEVLNVGDKVQVEIKEIDQRGKLSLTPVLEKSDQSTEA